MYAVKTAANGIVNKETIFSFSQAGNLVWANYNCGKIKKEFLVSTIENHRLIFSYCQLQEDGHIDNGQSICDLSINENGKLRMIENFTGGSKNEEPGKNIFEELQTTKLKIYV